MKNDFDDTFSEAEMESLDDLLHAAKWPETDPACLARLHASLTQYARPRKQRRMQRWAMLAGAVAAGLMVAATLWTLSIRKSKSDPSIVVAKATNEKPVQPDAVANTVKSPERLPISRPPTAYEELLFRIAIDKRKAAVKSYRDQSIDKAVAVEQSPIVTPPRLNLADHASVVRAILKRADAGKMAKMVAEEDDPALQEEILATLLMRGDEQSVGVYLDFVSQRNCADRALAAVDRASTPPVEVLFNYLRGLHVPRRLAAALVLGRIDGPETSRKLFQMVCGNVSRQEAMVGLLASSGDEASRYVNLAKQNASLAGVLSGARYQYRILSITQ